MPDPYYTTDDVTVWHGDCLGILRALPDASVDAVVTDPPAGIAFMNKSWDDDKGGRDAWISWLTQVMKEAYRVLKPGGHALVWALPRTSHWTATALENAGFEIRDCVVHLFGSGFPKSLDVSKAVDKAAGAEREVLRPRTYSLANDGGYSGGLNTNKPRQQSAEITAPATDEARRWEGWGTALKPGQEHWWLIRRPLAGTVVANVLEHGTGALNIGACRVEPTGESRPRVGEASQDARYVDRGGTNFAPLPGVRGGDPAGRWPTNLVFTHSAACTENGPCTADCPVAELDRQSGVRRAGGDVSGREPSARFSDTYGESARVPFVKHRDEGGASRFFPAFRYEAKAPASERPKVNGIAHATVKPLDLMRWMVRLITPPGGLVLDPFAGSGPTLEAAVLEGFRAVGIEREADYLPLIRHRLSKPLAPFLEVFADPAGEAPPPAALTETTERTPS